MQDMQKIAAIKSILVTNTRAYSDSNSIAADLAMLIAQNGKRVALIDAALRNPYVHRLFDIPNRVGLVDILLGRRSPSGIMQSAGGNNLYLLTAGQLPNTSQDLLASPEMKKFLKTIDAQFDKIIIHGPPFFYSEASSLAGLVDGVVLLIHPGHAKSEPSKAIIEKFQKTGATIIGIVMRDQPKTLHNQSDFIDRLLTYDRRTRLS